MSSTRKRLRGFKLLSRSIENYYEKNRGFSKQHAEEVARATAAGIARRELGQTELTRRSLAGRRKHSK